MYENNGRFYNQVREEQREMAKEIQQVKNYQVNQTMVESARNKALMEELAAVRSRQEEKNEERKLAEQGMKFLSNSAQSPTHRRGSWRLCVLQHFQPLRHPLSSQGVANNFAYPRIGVEAHAYAWIITPQPQSMQSPRLDVIQEA
ncbi:hypothetical protein PIB30_063198 [Stylosanthes scabra]|uniref:Uncharacterized protein n=1 Tax=Stylosanthes scabra TaxID=79078 RepID=A0ABU6VNR8_9FABA|nr:hypothetical protein [Stylosanthes scabra]